MKAIVEVNTKAKVIALEEFVSHPEEKVTPEQAMHLYTINNAKPHHE